MLPVIDIAPLSTGGDATPVAREIAAACQDSGFFYVTGHGVPPGLLEQLDAAAREFSAWNRTISATAIRRLPPCCFASFTIRHS